MDSPNNTTYIPSFAKTILNKCAFLCTIIILFTACNPTKKLKEDEHLLTGVRIINPNTNISNSDIESYLKQKPNKKILGVIRFHLWLHNMANEQKVKEKRILLNKKYEKRNAKRVKKGKKEKKYDRQLFGEWLLNIGEAPVIYDSLLTQKSSKQIGLFLNNKGYFIHNVTDSVVYKRKKKAKVVYSISASSPYTINSLKYNIQDGVIKSFIYADSSNTLIKKGNNYDVDVLQAERDRITNYLNNLGYFLFTRDYIYYEIDTTQGNKKTAIILGIKKYAQKLAPESDSIVESNHKQYYISNVYINTDFASKEKTSDKDSVYTEDKQGNKFCVIYSGKLKYKNKVLLNSIFLHKGDLYQLKNSEDTYKRLSELREFKTINISYSRKSNDSLDCIIQLSPVPKQAFSLETEGTNTSGNLGVSGSLTYQNRNLLKGAEVLEFRIKGGIQAQPTFSSNDNTQIDNISNATQRFNTIEFGPELNIYVPRFMLPFRVKESKRSNPKTIFAGSFTYQSRPDYKRTINNITFGYTWKETDKKRHIINPFVVNYVKVELQPDFLDYLNNNIKNLYILNSFRNHLTTSIQYTFIYNEQNFKARENFSFFKGNVESSGNILRGTYDIINNIRPNTFVKDTLGQYKLLDIVYSQYIRADADYRYYLNRNDINKIVFRIAAGIGVPFKNFPQLPFERSFFSGGANGIRAWQARTLGPGSYSDDGLFSFDQFGDAQLEANVEYRFKLFKKISGALFVDAGNTWLRRKDASRPGGEFDINRFYKEIAIGSGLGIRADFSFFIIRLDLGIKTHDPQFETGKRWVIANLFNSNWKKTYKEEHNNNKYNFLTFNIGIGYPF